MPITHVIVNPTSGNGRTGREWPHMQRCLAKSIGSFITHMTEHPQHAIELTREAIKSGAGRIIAIGGDGTLSEVVNGFFLKGSLINKNTVFGILSSGTGGDYARNLGFYGKWEDQLAKLEQASIHHVDVGQITSHNNHGQPTDHYFINECSIGMAANMARHVNKTPLQKRLAGRYAYLFAAIRALLRPKHWQVTIITCDGHEKIMDMSLAVFMNGITTGGGIRLAPDGRINDGLLDCLFVAPIGLKNLIRWIPSLYKGGLNNHPAVTHFSTRALTITSENEMHAINLEADGESRWQLPATISLLKQTLPVICSDLSHLDINKTV